MSSRISKQALVSIITVNYNQTRVTCELLDSIRKINYSNYEIIIVDNASKDNPKEIFNQLYPEAKFIRSDKNLGFAGGNNIGIKAARGEYLFFVNNDTEVTDGLIETLLMTFEAMPNAGIVCPKIMYYDKAATIQYVGYTELNPYTARNSCIGEREIDEGQYTTIRKTPYAHGAAMMIPKKVIKEAGLMPEVFFLYYEELDWSERIKEAGYTIYCNPQAVIHHKESISVGQFSPLKTYYLTRNRLLFMRRNATKFSFAIFLLFWIFFTIPKNLLSYGIRFEYLHLKAFIRGNWWNVKHKAFLPKQAEQMLVHA